MLVVAVVPCVCVGDQHHGNGAADVPMAMGELMCPWQWGS